MLRSKLPRLLVKDSFAPYILIQITFAKAYARNSEEVLGYFGNVQVAVNRQVIIIKTGNYAAGTIWFDSATIAGYRGGVVTHV